MIKLSQVKLNLCRHRWSGKSWYRQFYRKCAVKTPKKERVNRVLRFLHLLAYAVTYGSAIWMTFISGRILSRTIPREQFRAVQTRMFPYFLKFMVAGEALVALLSTIASQNTSKWSIPAFLFLIATTALNAFVLEPKTTKVRIKFFLIHRCV